MGRGRGGYTEIQTWYKDSGGVKVIDKHAIFVAEQYIDQGYEVIFRRQHQPDKSFDLTLKSSDEVTFIKNIEVKGVSSDNPSKMASEIERGFSQLPSGEGVKNTVAVYLPNYRNSDAGRAFAQLGFDEALRKGNVHGQVEVWFSDRTKIYMN